MLKVQVKSARTFLKVQNKITAPCACFQNLFKKERPQNYYDVLGVSTNATDTEIKEAFQKLSEKFDWANNSGEEMSQEKITEAYNVLSNPSTREVYDDGLRAGLRDHHRAHIRGDPNPEQEYQYPGYYKDPKMRDKAAMYWEDKVGLSATRHMKRGWKLSREQKREMMGNVFQTLLLATGMFLVMYFILKRQESMMKKNSSSEKNKVMAENLKRVRKPSSGPIETTVEKDLTERSAAEQFGYQGEEELKT